MKRFLATWTINTLAVLIAAKTVSGIHCDKVLDLLAASLLLGVFNAFLRPILLFLTLPLLILTLGLFRFVVNALVLYFIGYVLGSHFYVSGLWAAFQGALVISVVSVVLHLMTGNTEARLKVGRQTQSRRAPKDGDGPVIDV